MSWNKELQLKQVDSLIESLKPDKTYIQPKSGWIRLIRKTLAMSARVLGERIGIAQSMSSPLQNGTIPRNKMGPLHS